MSFLWKKDMNFELSQSLVIVLFFLFSIIVDGNHWASTQESYQVFPTELVVDKDATSETFPSIFSLGNSFSSQSWIKSPFFQSIICSPLYAQKNILKVQFQNENKEILAFDKPIIIAQKRNPSNRSDLPDSFPFTI